MAVPRASAGRRADQEQDEEHEDPGPVDEEHDDVDQELIVVSVKLGNKRCRAPRRCTLDFDTTESDTDSHEEDVDNESDSDEEYVPGRRTRTRNGAMI